MQKDTVRIGLMAPLSGIVQLYGREICTAAQIACDEINQNGGVLGKRLELIILDDGSLPETAVPAAVRLIDEFKCSALIGNLLSNSRIAVSALVSEPRRIPFLNFSFYEGSITGRYFFHFAALPNQQIGNMIPYMADTFGMKMYFAGNNYEWPRGSVDAAKIALTEYGGEILGEEYFPIGIDKNDIQNLITDISKSGTDVFVPYFAGSDQISLLNEFHSRGLKKKMAVVMGHYDEAMVSLLAPEVREGFYSSNTYFMTVNTAKNREVLKKLSAFPGVTGIWPDGNGILTNFGEGTYICMHAFAMGAERAGSVETEALTAALEKTVIEAPQGTVRMDAATHHAEVHSYLSVCTKEGIFSIIKDFGPSAPVIPQRHRSLIPENKPKETNFSSEILNKNLSFVSQSILRAIDVSVFTADENGVIIQANRGASETFGYSEEEFIGMSVNMLLPPHLRSAHMRHMKEFIHDGKAEIRMGKRGEIAGYRKDGTFFPAEASVSKFQAEGKWILVTTLIDVTGKKKSEDELKWKATHDPLTGLPNRTLIRDRLSAALQRTEKTGMNIGLMFIDLDNFKLVNDSLGHSTGDDLLVRIADILTENVRPGDTVARLGGDEFVILCEHMENKEELSGFAEILNNALRISFNYEGKEVSTSASIGLAIGKRATHTADDLLRESDTAMYISKQRGRNTWHIFSGIMKENSQEVLSIISGLRNAVDKNEFCLFYQPIVEETGKIKGLEALLRWKNEGKNIPPNVFIPIAEKHGMISSIGKWVFREACRMETYLRTELGKNSPYISVNLSAMQLNDKDTVSEFFRILKEEKTDPAQILLEMTETSIMSDVESNLEILNGLNHLGMKIAVDDFGTGYSSLLQLLRLPVSVIKIDREFVDGLDKRKDSRLITSAIIQMARALGKEIIAEGVENENQLLELKKNSCTSIQGFYFHRPMDRNSAVQLLKDSIRILYNYDSLYRILYVSKAQNLSRIQLDEILNRSRINNLMEGISGLLICNAGYFMQLLEGRKESVERLFQKISGDPRHINVEIVSEGETEQRMFSRWSMGFWDMENENIKNLNRSPSQKKMTLWELAKDPLMSLAFFEAISRTDL